MGESHPDVAMALGALGELYQLSGRYTEAEPLLRKALTLREQVLGAQHFFLALHLARLSRLYQDEGRYHEAQQIQ